MPHIDNWHLHLAWEKLWPQIVHGSFLWEGEPLNPEWCAARNRMLDQLEDGELVLADVDIAAPTTWSRRFTSNRRLRRGAHERVRKLGRRCGGGWRCSNRSRPYGRGGGGAAVAPISMVVV